MSKYSIAQLLLSDPVVAIVRRELRKLADGLNPDVDDVRDLIRDQVIKRELIEADEAKVAAKAVRKLNRASRSAKADIHGSEVAVDGPTEPTPESTVEPEA